MKIRNGFVSNSSSSSFILIGIKLDSKLTSEELARKYLTEDAINEHISDNINKYTGEDKDGWWVDLWDECASGGRDFINSEMTYVSDDYNSFLGKLLVDTDEELEDGEFSFSEISKIAENFDFESKLYFGTRQC